MAGLAGDASAWAGTTVIRAFLLPVCLVAGASLADVDVADYGTPGAVSSEDERRRLRAEFERQRRIEAERQRELHEEARRHAEARRAALAARPYPLRLTEARCTDCHPETVYLQSSHTALGWALVGARMKWLNGAGLAPEEVAVIATHLAENRPASGARTALEYGLALGVLILPLAGVGLWQWLRRRQRQQT